jgi:effector-binding domain-containing protein
VAEKGLKWAIAFPVNGKITVNPPLKKVELPSGPALTTVHMGPYPNLGKTHNRMMAHVKKNGFSIKWPIYEQYLNNPQMVKPEELKTRITYPVEK